jgi:cytochrome c-type biogenesis protein CcmH
MKLAASLLALFLFTVSLETVQAAAVEQPPSQDTYVAPLADPVLEARAKAMQRELRCVVCQGQSIDESNALLASDMRRLIREQIQDGKSDDEIKGFLVARYGTFVLMNPPVSGNTYVLWFGPFVLVLIGAGAIAVTAMRARRRLVTEPAPGDLDLPG